METLQADRRAPATAIPAAFTPHRVVRRVYDARRKMIESGRRARTGRWRRRSRSARCTRRGQPRPVERAGRRARHVLAPPRAACTTRSTGERRVPLRLGVRRRRSTPGLLHRVRNSSLSEFGVLGVRARVLAREPQRARAVGGAVRGLRELARRSSSTSSSAQRRGQVVAADRRSRLLLPHGYDGQGPEHSLVPRGAVPADVGRGPDARSPRTWPWRRGIADPGAQLADLQRHHARQLLPPPATAGAPRLPQAPHRRVAPRICSGTPSASRRCPTSTTRKMTPDGAGRPVQAPHHGQDPPPPATKVNDSLPIENADVKTRRLLHRQGVLRARRRARGAGPREGRMSRSCASSSSRPFPWDLVGRENSAGTRKRRAVVWCQEEPMNMGAYSHVAPRFADALQAGFDIARPLDALAVRGTRARRRPPPPGYGSVHAEEQVGLIKDALQ